MKDSNALLLAWSCTPLLPGFQGVVVTAVCLLAVGSCDPWVMWVVSKELVLFLGRNLIADVNTSSLSFFSHFMNPEVSTESVVVSDGLGRQLRDGYMKDSVAMPALSSRFIPVQRISN